MAPRTTSRRSTLPGDAPTWPPELIRGALDAAIAVARAGLAEQPPVEPPDSIRPVLRFARLSGPAAAAVRAALDDDAFRETVVAAGLDGMDAPAVLALLRPSGWEETLALLADAAALRAAAAANEKQTRTSGRRLAAAEAARARADDAAAAAEVAAGRARDALAGERARADEAVANNERLESEVVRLSGEVDELRTLLSSARRDLDTARRELAATREADTPPPVDAAEVASELTQLGDAVEAIQQRLTSIGALLEPSLRPVGPVEPVVPRPVPRPRRRPLAPPPGLLPEAPAAVAALVRTPRIVVLVDGYNVTIGRQGATLPLIDQRRWLVDKTSPLAARIDGEIWLVFDGDDVGAPPQPRGRRAVRTIFTDRDEEADDRIIRLVAELPADRPVAVVSDDRRVRVATAQGGANVLSVDGFLGVC